MVDATFLFVLLFGGALVGTVTAAVRGHRPGRKAIDIIAGTLGGFAGTPLWIAFARHGLPHIIGKPEETSTRVALLLADVYYYSPVIGGFLAVGLVALVARFTATTRQPEPFIAKLGDFIRIVGIVYLTIVLAVLVALIAFAAAYNGWSFVQPVLIVEPLIATAIVLGGGALARWARSARQEVG